MPKLFSMTTAVLAATLLTGGLFATPVLAQGASLASSLVESRAQLRILKEDDKQDAACAERHFTNTEVVTEPTVKVVSAAVSERKWQEQWTLERCGAAIGYRVFFTEVGDGGAYFSFLRTE